MRAKSCARARRKFFYSHKKILPPRPLGRGDRPHRPPPWIRHCSMYLSIFNSFRVIRCLNQCVVQTSLFLPHFCFPWGRPWGNHAKCCMGVKRIRCLVACTHLSSTVSQLFEPQVQKIAIFTYSSPHFCFPWGRP